MKRRIAAGASVVVALALAAASNGAHQPSATPDASSFIGPFTGVGVGSVERFGHLDNKSTDPDTHVVSTSNETYRARFLYSFRIENGEVIGSGQGVYLATTWHLEGENGKNGHFSCDPQVTGKPFGVTVNGFAADGVLYLIFGAKGVERNEDYDCGAKYTGYAGSTQYLFVSLIDAVAQIPGGYIRTSVTSPKIGHLTYHEDTTSGDTRHVSDVTWDISIKAPSPPGTDSGGGPGPSAAPKPGPATQVCTIKGTPGNDVLTGTSKQDVICGFGGNDVIRGGGGDDIVFGGPGNDTIDGGPGRDLVYGNAGNDTFAVKDGETDLVVGGAGKDRATVDKGRDRVSGVETVG